MYGALVINVSIALCLIQVRWQYTMRPALPPPRQDVTAMLGALLVMLVSASKSKYFHSIDSPKPVLLFAYHPPDAGMRINGHSAKSNH